MGGTSQIFMPQMVKKKQITHKRISFLIWSSLTLIQRFSTSSVQWKLAKTAYSPWRSPADPIFRHWDWAEQEGGSVHWNANLRMTPLCEAHEATRFNHATSLNACVLASTACMHACAVAECKHAEELRSPLSSGLGGVFCWHSEKLMWNKFPSN